ncbi:MAG: sigma-70 family RNA polymerase sigma factor [Odoribacteraceae bacterium]|jgi:RNA polymerase sigma-70 factor (ECF subfamily)|nr:sigma-70 family RNA polymerase sigma factor [Odoribacteraceae bacterium]
MHDEREIIRCIKQRDATGMKWIFDNYYQMLSLFALRYVHSIDDAEDLVQEVLILFWENKQGTHFTGSVRAYLFGAVHKAAATFLKNTGRWVFTDIDNHLDLPTEDYGAFEEEEVLRRRGLIEREIERLPEKCREVFIAIVLDNMRYKEVAEKLDISLNTVKTHYVRALKQLRANLDNLILLLILRVKEREREKV